MKLALCIMTYKHRYDGFLSRLNEIDKKFDIYVVTQTNDPKLNEYENYHWDSNIELMLTDATSIFEKREIVRCKMSEYGYDKYIQIDDDIKFDMQKITPETKRTTSDSYGHISCHPNELFNRMLEVSEEYDAGLVSPGWSGYLGFSKPGAVKLNSSINWSQIILLDINKLDANNIHYELNIKTCEDVDMLLQLLSHGINCCTVADYSFASTNISQRDVSKSSIYKDEIDMHSHKLGLYIKWHTPLYIHKNGLLKFKIMFKKYWNTTELPDISDDYNTELMRICTSGQPNDVFEQVYEYVKNNKK